MVGVGRRSSAAEKKRVSDWLVDHRRAALCAGRIKPPRRISRSSRPPPFGGRLETACLVPHPGSRSAGRLPAARPLYFRGPMPTALQTFSLTHRFGRLTAGGVLTPALTSPSSAVWREKARKDRWGRRLRGKAPRSFRSIVRRRPSFPETRQGCAAGSHAPVTPLVLPSLAWSETASGCRAFQ